MPDDSTSLPACPWWQAWPAATPKPPRGHPLPHSIDMAGMDGSAFFAAISDIVPSFRSPVGTATLTRVQYTLSRAISAFFHRDLRGHCAVFSPASSTRTTDTRFVPYICVFQSAINFNVSSCMW
eukprot:EG_transcript_41378